MKRLLSVLLIALMCLSLFACGKKIHRGENSVRDTLPPIPTVSEVTSPKFDEAPSVSTCTPLLYKISDSDSTVYLFGSIHVGTEDMYPLPDYVMSAFDSSDILAVECDVLAAQNDISVSVDALKNSLYSDGTTISDHISPTLYEKAKDILIAENYYNKALDYYMPYMWSSLISSFSTQNAGFDSNEGIDITLLSNAKDSEKVIEEIESVKFQYDMMASFSPELQNILLEDSVNAYNSAEYSSELNDLVYAWCEGDESKLTELLESTDEQNGMDLKLSEEYNNAMLTSRNGTMAEYVIKALSTDKDVFVCVGAAHIIGSGALVDILTQKGFTVSQVK